MKKIMSGLRRNKNSQTSITNITENHHTTQQAPPTATETNYADLFDNDYDENSKENSLNQPRKKRTNNNGKPKRRKKKMVGPGGGGMKPPMRTMMTISEMVECDSSEGEEVRIEDFTMAEEVEEEDNDGTFMEGDQERDEIEEEGEDEAADLDGNIMEDDVISDENDVGGECTIDNEKIESTTPPTNNASEELNLSIDVNNDSMEGLYASFESESSFELEKSFDEDIESNSNGSEEVNAVMVNNSEQVVSQQFPQHSANQHVQHHNTNDAKEDAYHIYLTSIGLYTPSLFMQSLRRKYQADLEEHA